MTAKIHQEVHCEFETKDPHVEGKGPVDPPLVGAEVSIGLVDHADPELAQNPDAGSGAPVDRRLHQRDEEKLRDEERDCAERHPRVEMDRIGEHGEQDAGLQQRFGDACTDKTRRSARLLRQSSRPRSLAPP